MIKYIQFTNIFNEYYNHFLKTRHVLFYTIVHLMFCMAKMTNKSNRHNRTCLKKKLLLLTFNFSIFTEKVLSLHYETAI